MEIKVRSQGDLIKALGEESQSIQGKLTTAAGTAGLRLQSRLRAETRSRLRGNAQGISNAWRIDLYPGSRKGRRGQGTILPGQTSASPAAVVWSKAPKVIAAFDDAVPIRARNGRMLAIPSANVPTRLFDNKRPTPELMERAGYDLELVENRRGRLFLVATNLRATGAGRFVSIRRPNRVTRRSGKGAVSVVMFFLVPQVNPPKLFDLDSAASVAISDLAARADAALAA